MNATGNFPNDPVSMWDLLGELLGRKAAAARLRGRLKASAGSRRPKRPRHLEDEA
jgi:hypothetical protein